MGRRAGRGETRASRVTRIYSGPDKHSNMVWACACTCTNVYACTCACAYMCLYVHMCMCVCVCMYVCVHNIESLTLVPGSCILMWTGQDALSIMWHTWTSQIWRYLTHYDSHKQCSLSFIDSLYQEHQPDSWIKFWNVLLQIGIQHLTLMSVKLWWPNTNCLFSLYW